MRANAEAMGYRVRRIAVDDGCYLVKGFDANVARIELKVDVDQQPGPARRRRVSRASVRPSRVQSRGSSLPCREGQGSAHVDPLCARMVSRIHP